MKTKFVISLFLLLIVNALQATDFKRASADNSPDTVLDSVVPKCAYLIKECLVKDQNIPTDCLFAVANHPFCEGSMLGNISFRRWQLSGDFHTNTNSIINYKSIKKDNCLVKFDNYFSKLINSSDLINQNNLIKLTESLEICNQQNSVNLVRP
jgi:hypothetical protein